MTFWRLVYQSLLLAPHFFCLRGQDMSFITQLVSLFLIKDSLGKKARLRWKMELGTRNRSAVRPLLLNLVRSMPNIRGLQMRGRTIEVNVKWTFSIVGLCQKQLLSTMLIQKQALGLLRWNALTDAAKCCENRASLPHWNERIEQQLYQSGWGSSSNSAKLLRLYLTFVANSAFCIHENSKVIRLCLSSSLLLSPVVGEVQFVRNTICFLATVSSKYCLSRSLLFNL